jgi:cytochrome c553
MLRNRIFGLRMRTAVPLAASSIFCALAAQGAGAADAGAAVRPDPAKGKAIAEQVCAGCHNADGNSVVPTFPRLAGQGAEYIVKELTDLAKPASDKTARENPIMYPIAQALSAADRQNLAAWFSSQTPAGDAASDDADVQTGQRIFRAGIPEKAVPACAGCHGPAGKGLPVVYPMIGGQHGEYIEAQLRAFRGGTRRNNVAMYQIAFRLSDPEIKALADYISGLQAQPN